MIKLRVVGTTDDHDQLVLSNKVRGTKGSHVLTIDRKLLDVLQEAVYSRREAKLRERAAPYAMPERVEPKVPPKEIQRQLRAGKSPREVAAALEVSQELVERFLQPVIYERIEVINDVQESVLEKPRLGRSALPLGEAVLANLVARRVSMDQERLTQSWAATRRNGEPWAVSFTFPYRGRSRTARWRFDPRARTVDAMNALARDIGWAAKGTKRVDQAAGEAGSARPARAARATKPKTAKRKTASKRSAAKRKPTIKRKTTAKRKPSAKRKPASKRAAPRRATKPKTATRKTTATRKPSTKRKTAAKRKTAKRKTAKRKTAKRKTAKRKTAAKRKPARRSTPSRARTSARPRARTPGTRSARPTRRASARRR